VRGNNPPCPEHMPGVSFMSERGFSLQIRMCICVVVTPFLPRKEAEVKSVFMMIAHVGMQMSGSLSDKLGIVEAMHKLLVLTNFHECGAAEPRWRGVKTRFIHHK
jgi:hypothetical protein